MMQLRDLFAMRAHGGWCHVLLARAQTRLATRVPIAARALARLLDRFDRATQARSRCFDALHGTETYQRLDVYVAEQPRADALWGYAAINQDFLDEILRAIPGTLAPYTFVDVGSGKGAAVLMASAFAFRRLVGIELNAELIDVARRNVVTFNASTGLQLAPEWVHCDFFKWRLPDEPLLFFFNNPFPEPITLDALEALERAVAAHRHPVLLVFRKAPKSAGDHLHRSTFWRPLRLAPYWRVYAAGGV